MKKIWGWLVGGAVVIVGGLFIAFNGSNPGVATVTNPSVAANTNPATDTSGQSTGNTTTTGTNTNSGGTSNTGTGTGTGGTPAGQYKDGTYTGPVTDAIYGQLEVVATIKNGQLIDTECPIYPNSSGHSMEVSQFALPQLKQEAITTQSANVNIISGATQTSQAYEQSLTAALAQAKA
jgi:uncharacterized protein with FMN-binding domain